jgi:hypothetical protein
MERLIHRLIVMLPLLLVCACNPPPRYIVVPDDSPESYPASRDNSDQRFVCLTQADAQKYRGLLALRKQSDIEDYERTRRTDRQDPVEGILFHLIRGEYAKASDSLHQEEATVPEYLRALLRADLTYEVEARNSINTPQLIKQYQDAFDVQPCAISREIINLRIRQVRYLR